MRPSFLLRMMLFLSIVSLAEAAIIRVPQDYPKIQLAINAAQPGDTVLVAEGIYYENLKITKRILLASHFIIDRNESHITNTIINGSQRTHTDSGSVVTFHGNLDTLSGICGFTVTGGTGNIRFYTGDNAYAISGGGIDLYNVTGLRVSHNIIRNNTTNARSGVTNNWGGGFSTTGTLHATNTPHYIIFEFNRVFNNTSTLGNTEGAGVEFWSHGRIKGNNISYNISEDVGAGISVGDKAEVMIADNYIAYNTITRSTGGGGGLFVYRYQQRNPYLILENNIFYHNTGTNGSHISLAGGNITLVNNTLTEGTGASAIYQSTTTPQQIRMMNTIMWNPSVSVEFNQVINTYAVNCLIRDGFTGGTNIINANPAFAPVDTLFHLTSASPAIGAGVLSATLESYIMYAPGRDYFGIPRPIPALSNPDLGAVEHPLGSPSTATLIRVPQDYAKIQDAITAAAEGSTILVSDGIYYENLRINKKITLASYYLTDGDTSHISRTIIDGGQPFNQDTSSVILVGTGTDTTTQITGFTIQNGRGTKFWDSEVSAYFILGNGIAITAGGATITHNIIQNNSLTTTIPPGGGGICLWPYSGSISYYVIENNIIRNNILALTTNASYPFDAGVDGGGAILYGSGRFCYNTVTGNSALYSGTVSRYYGNGGGAVFTGSSGAGSDNHVEIYGNKFINNSATKWAGAIYLRRYGINTRNMTADIVNNIFSENSAPVLGAAIVFSSGFYKMVNNTIVRNTGSEALWLEAISDRGTTVLRALNNIFWNPSCSYEYRTFSGGLSISVYSAFNLVRIQMAGFGNITSNPQLVAGDPNCTLGSLSPALGAGMMEWTLGDQVVKAPERDIFGNVRPWPTGYPNPDLGATEHSLTDLIEDGTIPTEFTLMQNYPNPFNPSTNIRYTIPQTGGDGMMVKVTLKVYDILGREAATLVDAEQEPGIYTVKFEAGKLSGGVYICRLTAGSKIVLTKKMLMLK